MTIQHIQDQASPVIPSRFRASTQDQLNYLFRKVSSPEIHCVIAMAGQLDAERMARAVRLTMDAEPVLGCRFVKHPWRPYWERRDDLDRLHLCSVVEPQDPESELWRFIAMPLDPYEDSQVQVRIFRSGTDTLCVKLDHLAADGAGAIQYVYLLAAIYRELGAAPAYRPRPNLNGSRDQFQVFKHCGPLALFRALRRGYAPQATRCLPSKGKDLSGRAFAIRQINAEQFQAIKSYSHQHQFTVNDILLAALYRAVFEVIDPPLGEPFPLVVPINLRRYLPAGHVVPVCTLSGATTVAITRQSGETFDSVAARTHAAMEAIKSDCPGLASAVLLELYFVPGFTPAEYAFYRIIGRAAKSGEGYLGLTNPGVIDERQMDFGDIKVADAYGVGGVAYPPGFGITSSTFRNAMTFTAGFCDTAIDRQDVEHFLDVFVRELP